MSEYHIGDRVRIDIPDETDPDHDRYHGEHAQIVMSGIQLSIG